jgi:hypothetical protein
VSLIIRQNCRPEVSCPMQIIDAIAFKLKVPRRAKVMITHMGFHAILWQARGQGRAAQLVNPLTANSRLASPLKIAHRAKSLVAGCNGGTTRRSGRSGPAIGPLTGSRPAAVPGRSGPPVRRRSEIDQVVHGHSLAWIGLCAPESAAPARGPVAPAGPAPGRTRLMPGRSGVAGSTGSASVPPAGPGPAPARNCLASKANTDRTFSIKWGPGPTRRPIDFGFDKARPLIKTVSISRSCTCPAQFNHHGAVGVIQ